MGALAVALLVAWSTYTLVSRSSVDAFLARKLAPLVGQTGLDRLDLVQPLVSAELVDYMPTSGSWELPRVRFSYANETSRDYVVTL
jgi:hypothetical protein